jgi:hypothetical protein
MGIVDSPSDQLSPVVISLMRGVLYRDTDEGLWQTLIRLQVRAREYVAVVGLELVLDEAEGCAYLRHRAAEEGESELPRLVPRRQLSYPVSLLLVLLRKKMVELDAGGGETRLILTRAEIVDAMRVFLQDATNEARVVDRVDAHINKVVELGFLRPLKGRGDEYEVRRILKAFVDAQWLGALDERLAAYRQHAMASPASAEKESPS